MPIVQHCTSFSYSLLPPHPLLAAPPVYPALPAPKVSGLLAAPKLTIIVEKYDPIDALFEEIGPLKSIEELDAELYALMDDRTRAIYQDAMSRYRRDRWEQ